jgi:hypothetical protein
MMKWLAGLAALAVLLWATGYGVCLAAQPGTVVMSLLVISLLGINFAGLLIVSKYL